MDVAPVGEGAVALALDRREAGVDVREAAELDVRCYLEKPFSPEVLRNVLSQAAGSLQS